MLVEDSSIRVWKLKMSFTDWVSRWHRVSFVIELKYFTFWSSYFDYVATMYLVRSWPIRGDICVSGMTGLVDNVITRLCHWYIANTTTKLTLMIYYAVWDYRNLQSETTSSDNIQKEYNVGLLLRLHSSHQFLVQPYTYASYNICIIYDFIYCLCSQIMMCNFYISMRLTTISPTGKYNLHFVNWWIENISLYQSESAGKFNYMIYIICYRLYISYSHTLSHDAYAI